MATLKPAGYERTYERSSDPQFQKNSLHIGYKNGSIVVIGITHEVKNCCIMWKCKCDKCGKIFKAVCYEIKAMEDCGCVKKKEIKLREEKATREKIEKTRRYKSIRKPGEIFGNFIYVKDLPEDHYRINQVVLPFGIWRCRKCSGLTVRPNWRVVDGLVEDCGWCSDKVVTVYNRNHGISGLYVYDTYRGIKKRCYNEKAKSYEHYGGRGIVMCDEWKYNPQSFVDWAYSNGFEPKIEIDRVNVNRNYSPENCQCLPKIDNLRKMHVDRRRELLKARDTKKLMQIIKKLTKEKKFWRSKTRELTSEYFREHLQIST